MFRLPFLSECNGFATLDISRVSLAEALLIFYSWLFPPTSDDDPMLQLFMRLHAREEAEPSGVLDDAMVQAFRPNHEKLLALLCREFGLKQPDAEVDRLSFGLVGLATVYFHNRAAVNHFAPHLIKGKQAKETMAHRLVDYAVALIEAERARRSTFASGQK